MEVIWSKMGWLRLGKGNLFLTMRWGRRTGSIKEEQVLGKVAKIQLERWIFKFDPLEYEMWLGDCWGGSNNRVFKGKRSKGDRHKKKKSRKCRRCIRCRKSRICAAY